MADLMFRKGLLANLPATYTEGAISITTDVPGMYIDLADKRIRIGDFVSVANLDAMVENAEKYGYSTNTLFYAEAENVLCKIVEGENGPQFQQINSTEEIETAIESINGSLTTIGQEMDAVEGRLDVLEGEGEGSVAAAVKAEKDRAEGIEKSLQDQIDAITGTGEDGDATTIAGLNAKISELDTAYKAADSAITGRLDGHDTKIGDLETALTETGSIGSKIKANADAIAVLNGGADVDGSVAKAVADAKSDLQGKLDTLSGTVNGHTSELVGLTTTSGQHTEAIGTLQGKVNTLETHASTYEAKVNTLEGQMAVVNGTGDGSIAQAKQAGVDAKAAADAAQGKADANEEAIGEINEALEVINGAATVAGSIAEAKAAADAAQGDADALEELIGSIPASATAKTVIAYVDEKAAAASGSAAAVQANLDKAVEDIGKNTQAISDMDTAYKAADEKHTQDIAKNAEDIGKNAEAIAKEIKDRGDAISALSATLTKAIQDEAARADAEEKDIRADFALADQQTLADAKDYADSKLAAADAMKFKGSVGIAEDGSSLALPTTGVEAGWTYVVAAEKLTVDGVVYHAGDLVVANADQGEEAVYAGGWTHVKTGYDAQHEATLAADGTAIKLTSHVGTDLGSVAISAKEGSNLVVENVDGGLVLSMAWGEF